MHTLMRFGALDPRDDKILDNYALITDCGLYNDYFTMTISNGIKYVGPYANP